MKKIRMGVIGLGGISRVHIEGIQRSPDAELVAVCDINPEVLKSRGDLYGIPEKRRFTAHTALLKCPEVDAVSICTANDSHCQIAMDAVKYGKPFALEKPVALAYPEAAGLELAAREEGVSNMVCFSYRFKTAARYARHLIRQGALGKIYHIYVQYFQGWAMSESIPLIWRFSKAVSGSGALGDLGCHMIDMARFLVGDFTKICSQAGTFIEKRKLPGEDSFGAVDVDDYCHFLAELAGGVPAVFAISRYAFGRGNYQRIEVYGEKGALVYNLEFDDSLQVCLGDVYGNARDFHNIPVPQHFAADQMQSFFNIVNGRGDGLAASIEDGAASQRVVDAVIASFEQGKWINISNQRLVTGDFLNNDQ